MISSIRKRLWKYAYHVTTPQNVDNKNCSRRKIHFDKKLFKLYFKFNLCWYILLPFCFLFSGTVFFRVKTRFLCVHQMPPKGFNSTLNSFFSPSIFFFSLFNSRRQKQKANTLLRFFRRFNVAVYVSLCALLCGARWWRKIFVSSSWIWG